MGKIYRHKKKDHQGKDTVINNHSNKPLANRQVTANSDMWSNLNEVISHLADTTACSKPGLLQKPCWLSHSGLTSTDVEYIHFRVKRCDEKHFTVWEEVPQKHLLKGVSMTWDYTIGSNVIWKKCYNSIYTRGNKTNKQKNVAWFSMKSQNKGKQATRLHWKFHSTSEKVIHQAIKYCWSN